MARIVVVDDEPAILRMSSRILQRVGHVVVTFENGRLGIEHLRREAADLLITDIFMPDMEGLETVKLAHALLPEMPIVAVSGGGSMQSMNYLEFARRFGAVATLGKPFRPVDLLDLVTRLLARSDHDSDAVG